MSTTQSQPEARQRADVAATTAEEVARDLTDLYTLLIHESPEVCSNCHRRIRAPMHGESRLMVPSSRLETREQNTLGTGDDELEPLRRGGDGTAGFDVEAQDDYWAIRKYNLKTYCGHCGQPGGRARDDTPSKREMLSTIDSLVTRLDEAGVPVNPDKLRFLVDHLRSQEDLRGKETEIWRAAVAKAVEYARPRDCLRCTYAEYRRE